MGAVGKVEVASPSLLGVAPTHVLSAAAGYSVLSKGSHCTGMHQDYKHKESRTRSSSKFYEE